MTLTSKGEGEREKRSRCWRVDYCYYHSTSALINFALLASLTTTTITFQFFLFFFHHQSSSPRWSASSLATTMWASAPSSALPSSTFSSSSRCALSSPRAFSSSPGGRSFVTSPSTRSFSSRWCSASWTPGSPGTWAQAEAERDDGERLKNSLVLSGDHHHHHHPST